MVAERTADQSQDRPRTLFHSSFRPTPRSSSDLEYTTSSTGYAGRVEGTKPAKTGRDKSERQDALIMEAYLGGKQRYDRFYDR